MLRNERCRGVLIFGRTTWEVRKGRRRKVQAPEATWIRVEVPHLRIIPETLWRTTHQRLDQTFASYRRRRDGRLSGRPERSLGPSKYLLIGMLRFGGFLGTLVPTHPKAPRGARLLPHAS